MSPASTIYHLVPESELRAGRLDGPYFPAGFAIDGFVHCSATPEITLAVARAYFSGLAEPLLVLWVETSRLGARVRFEGAAPVGSEPPGVVTGTLFPHVYGPIDLAAIRGVAQLSRSGGDFAWPERFEPLE